MLFIVSPMRWCVGFILLIYFPQYVPKVASMGRFPLFRGGNRLDDYISYSSDQLANPGDTIGCAWIFAKETASRGRNDYTAFFYTVDATAIQGRRVRLMALLRVKDVDNGAWGGLFMSIESADGRVLAFDNMINRPVSGTTPTYSYGEYHEIVLDVPASRPKEDDPTCVDPESVASVIVLGGFLAGGKGFLAMSEVRFLEASIDSPTTAIPPPWFGPGTRESLGPGVRHEEFTDPDNARWLNYCNTRGNPNPMP